VTDVFACGDHMVPGCSCGPDEEMPCWQRVGLWPTSGCGSPAADRYLAAACTERMDEEDDQ